MSTKDIVATIGGIIGLVSIVFGVYFFFEKKFVSRAEATEDNKRIYSKIEQTDRSVSYLYLDSRRDDIEKELETLRSWLKSDPKNKSIKGRIKELENKLDRIQKQLDVMDSEIAK